MIRVLPVLLAPKSSARSILIVRISPSTFISMFFIAFLLS